MSRPTWESQCKGVRPQLLPPISALPPRWGEGNAGVRTTLEGLSIPLTTTVWVLGEDFFGMSISLRWT